MLINEKKLRSLIYNILLEYKNPEIVKQIIGYDESERSVYFKALTNYSAYSNLFRGNEILRRKVIGIPVRANDEFGELFNSIFSGFDSPFILVKLLENLGIKNLFEREEMDVISKYLGEEPKQVLNDEDRSNFVDKIFAYFGKNPIEDWVPSDRQLETYLKSINGILVNDLKGFKADIELSGNLDYSFKKSRSDLKRFTETLKLKSIGEVLKRKSSTTSGSESTTDYKKRRIASNYLINNSKIVKDNFLITHFVGAYNRPDFYFHFTPKPGITDIVSFASAYLGKIKDDDESTVAIPKGEGSIAINKVGDSQIGVIFGGDQMIVKGMYSGDVSTGRGDVAGSGIRTKSLSGEDEGYEKLPDKLGSKNYLDMLVIDPIEFKEKMSTPGSVESTRYNETITDKSQVVGFINISDDDWISLIEKETELINGLDEVGEYNRLNASIQHATDAIKKISEDPELKFVNKDRSESNRDVVIEKLELFKQALENLVNVSFYFYTTSEKMKPIILSSSEIIKKIKDDPKGNHHVWKDGFNKWMHWSEVEEFKNSLNEAKVRNLIRNALLEYVVPMGYSLKSWKKKKKKEKISNKDYADQTKGDKWKVVHGKTKGKIGKPINKSAKNLSYAKATRMHSAIELNEKIRDLLFDD